MTKKEFEKLAGGVGEVEFARINFVYTFHPAISETTGKQQIAELYKTFGMCIINDMMVTAGKAKTLEDEIRKRRSEIEDLQTELTNLRNGEV